MNCGIRTLSTAVFQIGTRTKALVLAVAMLSTCQPASPRPSSDQPVRVTRVEAAKYEGTVGGSEKAACDGWRLGTLQVEQFFRLSEPYGASPYGAFYQVPCSISGELQAEGRSWDFQIDGGGTAIWTSGDETRYWGCSDQQCANLVLLATDLMDPDAP